MPSLTYLVHPVLKTNNTTIKKREVVKDNKLFNNIIKTGKWVKNNYFVIYYLESNNEIPKFGIAVVVLTLQL